MPNIIDENGSKVKAGTSTPDTPTPSDSENYEKTDHRKKS